MAAKTKLSKEDFDKLKAEEIAALKVLGLEYILPDPVDGKKSDGLMVLGGFEAIGGYDMADAEKMMSTLDKERGESKAARALAAELGDISPKAAKAAIAKLKERENWKPDEVVQKQREADRAELQEQYAGEIKTRDELTTKLRGQLERTLVDAAATQAIVEAKGKARALFPHVKSAIRVIETKDGEYVARVFKPDGTEMTSRKSKDGVPMPISEYVETLKSDPDLAPLFEGTGVQGSGAQTRTGTTGQGRFAISKAEAADFTKYERLAAEAAKVGEIVQVTG